MSALAKQPSSPNMVLAQALLNTGKELGLNQEQLAAVIGVHRSTISRLKTQYDIDPTSKSGELALLLIRVYRAVFALTGGDKEWMHYFMRSYNEATRGVPVEQIQTVSGLMTVLQFVDAIRGKI